MKKFMALTVSMMLATSLCACGSGSTPQTDTNSPADTAMTEETETATDNETAEAGEVQEVRMSIPEDNGMAGVYKRIEMEDYGAKAYLLIWDDGIGSIDMVGTGTVTAVSYNDDTMQAADEGAVPQKYTYTDGKIVWTYTDESGDHVSTFVKLTEDELAAYEELGVGSVTEAEDNEGNLEDVSPWPEDKGDVVGVYKWVEMEDIGVKANLIIMEDGIGVLDMLGVTESVTYDDTTMQSSGEGALPQSYTYENGTLIWTAKDDTGESKSTFVKLTEEELAEYQERGIGNAE